MLAISDPIDEDVGGPRSQASYAYETIRGDVLSGRHPPNKKLKIQDLAAELKVSPGAVREALSRLVPEQLVVSYDQRGFAVAPLSVPDLEDLTDLRCEVETIALRRSVELGDIDWEARLTAAAHRLRATPIRTAGPDSALNAGWVAAHAAFHRALVAACGSKRLLALHGQLYEQSERYRGLSGRIETERRVVEEHQEIFELALVRDVERALAAMVRHIRLTTTLIVEAARTEAVT